MVAGRGGRGAVGGKAKQSIHFCSFFLLDIFISFTCTSVIS